MEAEQICQSGLVIEGVDQLARRPFCTPVHLERFAVLFNTIYKFTKIRYQIIYNLLGEDTYS